VCRRKGKMEKKGEIERIKEEHDTRKHRNNGVGI
jgi:hypothetical protein